jgi:hypothetical protein
VLEGLNKKEVLTAISVVAFMGSAYFIFRRMHLQKSPLTHHIRTIQDNISKTLEERTLARSLSIEEQHAVEHGDICMLFTLISKLSLKDHSAKEAIRNPFLPPFEEVPHAPPRDCSSRISDPATACSSISSTSTTSICS